MAAITYTSVVSLSLLLLLLSVSHACGARGLNPKQLNEACDKTRHPGYCLSLIKARHDDLITYHIKTPQDMAQYLMSIAAGVGHELAALARKELPRGASARRCVERCAARFDAAASKLGIVDGELLDDSRETFQLVYRYVQSNAQVLAQSWNACPGTASAMAYKQKHLHFTLLLDIILGLGKLHLPPCMAPASSPSV